MKYGQVNTPVQSMNPDEGRRLVRITTAIAKLIAGTTAISQEPIYIVCQNADGISEYNGASSQIVAVLFYDPTLLRHESYESVPFVINSSVNSLTFTATQL